MQNIPSLFIALGVCISIFTASLLSFSLNQDYILILLISLTIFGIAKQNGIAKIISTVLLGLWIYSTADSLRIRSSNTITHEMQGTIYGEIISILNNTPNRQRVLIQGFIDGKYLPRIEPCRIALTIQGKPKKHFTVGTVISSTCILHIPQQSNLPNEFDEYAFSLSNNIQFLSKANSKNITIIEFRKTLRSIGFTMQQSIQKTMMHLLPKETAGIAIAMLLGDRTQLPQETKQAFSIVGTAHILSVSGFHAGIIALIIWTLLSFIFNRFVKCIILGVLLFAFLIIINGDPPAIRACIMSMMIAITQAFDRKPNALHILFLTTLFMIVLQPPLIFAIGFQMSVAGMAGLIILQPFFMEMFRRIFTINNSIALFIMQSLAASLSASFTLIPLIAWYFSSIALAGPLANLIIIPIFTIAIIFLIIALAIFPFSYSLAIVYSTVSHYCILIADNAQYCIANIDGIILQSTHAFTISLLIIAYSLYIIKSCDVKSLIFRGMAGLIFIFGAVVGLEGINLQNQHHYWQCYPRQFFVASILEKEKEITIVLQDRKIKQYPRSDVGFIKYCSSQSNKKLQLFYQGNCSEKTALAIQSINQNSAKTKPINTTTIKRLMGFIPIVHAYDKHANNIVQLIRF